MSHECTQRWSLAVIALFMLPTAIQATFSPESWFDDFPLGRGWVAAEGDFGYHVDHLDGLDTVDRVGSVASLVSIPVLAAFSLWAGLRPETVN
jgi:hypothetical protein